MRQTDIAIVGAGLAGSTAAAMLGRAGINAIAVDPHEVYPPDLRCEKLDGTQVAVLRKTGLAEPILSKATFDGEAWIARLGRLVDKRPSDQHGIMYDTLVNAMRAEIAPPASLIYAKVASVATSDDRQKLVLSNGEEISARLIVLANGLNVSLRHTLGLTRDEISPCHSITIAFDLVPVGRPAFDFPALTYYTERASDRIAYITLFPIGSTMRANFMVYRDMNDPWLRRMRSEPRAALAEVMPNLGQFLGEYDVPGVVKIRPADLYVTGGYRQPGVVLVGDAFCTSCPAAGTGTTKVFTDVERLCNIHIPAWLSTPGMGLAKIDAFYDDPVKRATDQHAAEKAFRLRSLSIDETLPWRLRRQARYFFRRGVGVARRAREWVQGRVPGASADALAGR